MYKAVGVVSDEELMTGYRRFGSRLEGHPTPVLPWVDVATGSLGQGAIARDTLGDPQAAERALQHALDLAGPEQVLSPFLSDPPPGPPGRQDRYPRAGGTLIGPAAAPLAGADRPAALPGPPARHLEALTHGETRVLHYLPTNLSAREIAGELYLSVNTVKTHQRHLYQKLGARSRTQAVEQARALGLIAPSSRRR